MKLLIFWVLTMVLVCWSLCIAARRGDEELEKIRERERESGVDTEIKPVEHAGSNPTEEL